MDTLEAIKNRRSFRAYKPTPIDEPTLAKVLEAARWAPSWANTQCWRFIVVKEPQLKASLADCLVPGNGAAIGIKQAPILIVACAEKNRAGFRAGNAVTDKGDWYMFDLGLAMENLVLAAHALGLGTVHVGAFDSLKAAALLEVPDGYCVVEMTPLGVPEGGSRPPVRKEINEIVFYEKFGSR